MSEARITVDPAFRVGPVDPRVYGSFVEHLGRCVYTGIYEPTASNSQDAPDRIVPRAGADIPVHDGVLETALPALSWNMLRIGSDDR